MESKIRPATEGDIRSFYGAGLPFPAECILIELDGEVVMVAGVMRGANLIAFMDMRDRLRSSPRHLLRAVPEYRKLLNKFDEPVVAKPNQNEPSASRFLSYVGFFEIDAGIDERVFLWPHSYCQHSYR